MSSVVIPWVVVTAAAVTSVVVALHEPGGRTRHQVPTIGLVGGRGPERTAARRPQIRELRTTTGRPRRRLGSGIALVSLVTLLGVLLALGLGAVVVAATLALKSTAG